MISLDNRINRYLRVMEWARKRYTKNSLLPVSYGIHKAPYSLIEQAAWNKYLN